MSIDLIGVSHSIRLKRGKSRFEFRDINMHIEEGQRVAILGTKGGGLEELLNVICGAVYPIRGNVVLSSEISWPIGEAGFLSSSATFATNIRFVARLYEVDVDAYIKRVSEIADIEDYWNEKMTATGKEVRSRFAFALGVCLPFDIYIFESATVADKEYREKAEAIIEQLGHDHGIVITTSKGSVAERFCDRAFVLDDGKITYYEDIAEAVAHLEQLAEPVIEVDGETEEAETESGDDPFDVI